MKIKTILFDLDGTVIDSGPGVKRCICHALRHFGMDKPDEASLNACVGPPLTSTFGDRFGIPKDRVMEAISVFRKEYNAGGIYECALYPGIRECIRALHEKGYDVAIASSKVDAACKRLMEHFELTPYFYDIIGSTPDAGREKKVDVLNAFFELHPDHKKEETVLIGDTFFDAEGAREAGIPFIGVTYGYGTEESLREEESIGILSAADEILPWIESHT